MSRRSSEEKFAPKPPQDPKPQRFSSRTKRLSRLSLEIAQSREELATQEENVAKLEVASEAFAEQSSMEVSSALAENVAAQDSMQKALVLTQEALEAYEYYRKFRKALSSKSSVLENVENPEPSNVRQVLSDSDIERYFQISKASYSYRSKLDGKYEKQGDEDFLGAIIFSLQSAYFTEPDLTKIIVFEGDSAKRQSFQIADFIDFIKAFKKSLPRETVKSLSKFRQEVQDVDFSDIFAEIQDDEIRGIEDYKMLGFQERKAFLERIGEENRNKLFQRFNFARQTSSSVFGDLEKLDFLMRIVPDETGQRDEAFPLKQDDVEDKRNQVFLFKGVDENGDAFFIVFSNFEHNLSNSLSFFGKDNSPVKADFERLLYSSAGDNEIERFFTQTRRDEFRLIDVNKKRGNLAKFLMSKFNRGFAFQGFTEDFLMKGNSQNQEIIDVLNAIVAAVLGSKRSLVEAPEIVQKKLLFLKERISFLLGFEIEGRDIREFLQNVQNYFDGLDLQKEYLAKVLSRRGDVSQISDANSLKQALVDYFLNISAAGEKIKRYIERKGGIQAFERLGFEEKAKFLEDFFYIWQVESAGKASQKSLEVFEKYKNLMLILKGEIFYKDRYEKQLDKVKQRISYISNSYKKTNIFSFDDCSESYKHYLVLMAFYEMIRVFSTKGFQEKIADVFKQEYKSGEGVFLEQRYFLDSDFEDYYAFLQENNELFLHNFAGIKRVLAPELRSILDRNEKMMGILLGNNGVEIESLSYLNQDGQEVQIQIRNLLMHFLEMISRKASIIRNEDSSMQRVLVKNLMQYLQEFNVSELHDFDSDDEDVRIAMIKKSLLLFIYQYFKDSQRIVEEKTISFKRFLRDDLKYSDYGLGIKTIEGREYLSRKFQEKGVGRELLFTRAETPFVYRMAKGANYSSLTDFSDLAWFAPDLREEEAVRTKFSLYIPVAISLAVSNETKDIFLEYFRARYNSTEQELQGQIEPFDFFKQVKSDVFERAKRSINFDALSNSQKFNVTTTLYSIVYNSYIESRSFVQEEHQRKVGFDDFLKRIKQEHQDKIRRGEKDRIEHEEIILKLLLKGLQERVDSLLERYIKDEKDLNSDKMEQIFSRVYQEIVESTFFKSEIKGKAEYEQEPYTKLFQTIVGRFEEITKPNRRRLPAAPVFEGGNKFLETDWGDFSFLEEQADLGAQGKNRRSLPVTPKNLVVGDSSRDLSNFASNQSQESFLMPRQRKVLPTVPRRQSQVQGDFGTERVLAQGFSEIDVDMPFDPSESPQTFLRPSAFGRAASSSVTQTEV